MLTYLFLGISIYFFVFFIVFVRFAVAVYIRRRKFDPILILAFVSLMMGVVMVVCTMKV